uniref:Trialysin n=1 Tax=Triatoma matogrossensis TaxID=162370 RepID=E2J774_9HEMI
MSKLWLLLLLVAAFQFARSYPAVDEYEDEPTNDEAGVSIGDPDEERFKLKPGKVLGKIAGKAKKAFKKVGTAAKAAMKKGATLLKNMGVKISPLQCVENSCQSCITFKIPSENSFCLSVTYLKTNVASYLVVAGKMNQSPKFEEKIKLGDMPRCLNLGGFLGKVCIKGIEGHAKSSSGQANINICLGVLAEKFGVGGKFCAIYANKKLQVKVSPQTFAGTTSDDGDIVKLDDNGEDATTLDAEEI